MTIPLPVSADAGMGQPTDFTGRMWRNADGTVGLTIADLWGWPIHLIATRDADGYALRGWRGEVPDALRIDCIDGVRT